MTSSTLASGTTSSGNPNPNPNPWNTLTVPESSQDQDPEASSSSLDLSNRLCFVQIQKQQPPNNASATSSYWWPAVLYNSLAEFQSSNVLDPHAKVALSTQLMKQHLEHARSGRPAGIPRTFFVARLLGCPMKDLQVLGHDEHYQDYHFFLAQILSMACCQPNVFQSTQEYLKFHKGLDEAAAILMEHVRENDMTAPPPIEQFYQLAQEALQNGPPEQEPAAAHPQEQLAQVQAQAPNSPVGDRSVAAVSISNESWISANKGHRNGGGGDDATTVATASSPLPAASTGNGNEETPRSRPPSPIRIPPQGSWETVWMELQFQGWTCQKHASGNVLYRQHYPDPGMSLETLQAYMKSHYGWTGPAPTPTPVPPPVRASRRHSGRGRPADPHASSSAVPSSSSSRSDQQAQTLAQIQFYKFGTLWLDTLTQRLEWTQTKGPGGITDWIYMKPNVTIETGILLEDMFHSTDQVLDYCRDHNYYERYANADRNESRPESSSSEEEEEENQVPQDDEDEASHNDEPETQEAATSPAASRCPSEEASHDEYMSDHSITILEDTHEDVDTDADGNDPSTPVGQRTVPQDPGKPLFSPASSPGSSDASSSSPYNMDSDPYYQFQNVWQRLKVWGWDFITPPRPFHQLDPNWYVRPEFDVKQFGQHDYQENQDYFKSGEAVVEWVKRMDQRDKDAAQKYKNDKKQKAADLVAMDHEDDEPAPARNNDNRKKRALQDVSNDNSQESVAPSKKKPKAKDSNKADDSVDAHPKPSQSKPSKAAKKDSSNKSDSQPSASEISKIHGANKLSKRFDSKKENAKKKKKGPPLVAPKLVLPCTISPHRNKAPWAHTTPLPKSRPWTLCQKAGIVYSGGLYYLSNESPRSLDCQFAKLHDIQKYMATKGIPNIDRLSKDEQEEIIGWVKDANVPHRTGEAKPEEIRLLTVREVARLLVEKLKFESSGAHAWKAPEKSSLPISEFYNLRHFRRVLCGIPDLEEACRPDTGGKRRRGNPDPLLTHQELLALRLWSASSSAPLPVFGACEGYHQKMANDDLEQEEPSQDEEEAAAQSSSDEDSSSPSKSDVEEEEDAGDDDGATGDERMDQVQEIQHVEESSNADVEMEQAAEALDLLNSSRFEKELANQTRLDTLASTQALADEEALYEARVKGAELKFSLPRSNVCWKLLQEIGFRWSSGSYLLPREVDKPKWFTNATDLRKFLCKTGIPNYSKTASLLTQEQRLELERAIRHAFVPVISSWTELDDHILTDDEAIILLIALGFEIAGDRYFFPGAKSLPGYDNPVHGVHFLQGIQEVRFGIRTTEDLLKIGKQEETGRSGRRQRAKPTGEGPTLNETQQLSLRLWAAETEDPLPAFPDQSDPVDKVASTEPSGTEVQLSSKSNETSSVKVSAMEDSSTNSDQVPAPSNVESTDESSSTEAKVSSESDGSVKVSTMKDSSTDSAQVPAPNDGAFIVEPRVHQDMAEEEPRSEQENGPKTFPNSPERVHEDKPMLDKLANNTVETSDRVQVLDPSEEPAAPKKPLSSREPVIDDNPMLDQISETYRGSSDEGIVAGTSDPSSLACSNTLSVLKESSPESCQEDTSIDAMGEHRIDSDAQSPKDIAATEDVADTGDRMPTEKRDFEVSKNGDRRVIDQLESLHTADDADASITEHDNGQDAAYQKYGSFFTQPVDEADDAASDDADYGSTPHYQSSPPTRDSKPRVSYEPGEAQPFGDEASDQEVVVDREKNSIVEDFGVAGSFAFSPQERTRNDRDDCGSTFPMTQPDAENELFGHVTFDHQEEDGILPNF